MRQTKEINLQWRDMIYYAGNFELGRILKRHDKDDSDSGWSAWVGRDWLGKFPNRSEACFAVERVASERLFA